MKRNPGEQILRNKTDVAVKNDCQKCAHGWTLDSCDRCSINFGHPGQCDTCMIGWAGQNCDSCAHGWTGDNCS